MEENIGSHIEDRPKKFQKKINLWMVVSVVLILVLVGLLFIPNSFTGKSISETEAGEQMVEYLNGLVGGGVELIDVEDKESLYEITVLYQNQEIPVFMTKDGEYFIQGADKMTEDEEVVVDDNTTQQQTTTDVPKTDKPVVELFVMSHCPYGTQAEKGIIPVVKLLKDKIDFKIRFVYYAMHGDTEIYEQLNQYCIQKEQEDKYLDYLECFLEEGEGEACLAEVGIDTTALETCTSAADEEFNVTGLFEDKSSWLSGYYPLFNVDKDLNSKYNIGGSPTLIVNGVETKAGRDSASYLQGVCNAFNEQPEECSEELSSTSPSPGFGYEGTGSDTTATCG